MLKRDIRARMFVFTYGDAFVASATCTGVISSASQPSARALRSALLAAQCICVLAVACNAVFASEVVRGLRHRIDAVPRLHHRINAMPSERAVLQFLLATETQLQLSP